MVGQVGGVLFLLQAFHLEAASLVELRSWWMKALWVVLQNLKTVGCPTFFQFEPEIFDDLGMSENRPVHHQHPCDDGDDHGPGGDGNG